MNTAADRTPDVHARDFLLRDVHHSGEMEAGPMWEFLKNRSGKELGRLLCPFPLSLMLGVILMPFYPRDWLGREQLKVLGDGLFVAGVIGLAIELFAASILIDHAATELSSRLVGYGLPRAAQLLIHDLVHQTKRVYRDYRVTYSLAKHTTKPNVVIIRSVVPYIVVNNGSATESYRPGLAQEGIYGSEVTRLEYGPNALAGNELRRATDADGVISVSPPEDRKDFALIPSKASMAMEELSEEQKCVVRWQYAMEMPSDYSDVIAFTGVTINPTIELTEIPNDLAFYATVGKECYHDANGHTWSYRRALIAEQHLRVWWKGWEETVTPPNPTTPRRDPSTPLP